MRQFLVSTDTKDIIFEIEDDAAINLVVDQILFDNVKYLELRKEHLYSDIDVSKILDAIQGAETLIEQECYNIATFNSSTE